MRFLLGRARRVDRTPYERADGGVKQFMSH